MRSTQLTEVQKIRIARLTSVVIGFSVVALGILVGMVPGNLLEICYKTINLLVSPLFGLFFMALFVRRATSAGTLVGAAVGVAVMVMEVIRARLS